ncbi:two-component sensor histidine kinase [Thermoanaerobacterium thermosaccharolyticum]|uniref:sensor histidine kinase n=1 Tax=Thermoanaerobacterium thermosaccharolyticum TaxID=1517 RepID=UPI000C0757FB|nr:HAMP domain-containing sensor histidine kinase [Thermoanaerobacterium thermosaccharolyticum]PHO08201.1 two-component sensor histidine kinase [Thermoanaerobacterium thermosaccharolyticum]
MFKKLRNKFLILNMSMTSSVMMIAFAVIYIISYNNINSEIAKKLSPQAGMQTVIERRELPDDTENSKSKVHNRRFSLDDPYSFFIQVDGNGKILEIDSPFHMNEESYKKAADIAWSNKKSSSIVTLEGKQWKYVTTQMKKQVIQGNGQSYTIAENKYQIMFLDVTMYKKTLYQLLITLLSVGIIMLFIIFLISLYFANRAIKPIVEAWERQKQFVADASHELKTPISIINANYDVLLANREETIDSQLKWLDYIKIGTDRMTKLINDLLSLAKMEDLRFEMQKVPFNMSDAVNDVILSMEAVAAEKDIKLIRSIEPDIIVKSDSERIKQVITILFDNAVKYTDKKGQIEISLTKSKRHVTFSIKNSGKGIAKQDLPKIFDRFYRADSSRTHDTGSYGLGLSIAKTIIERLGGEIYAESVENEYTTFTFTLEF